MKNLFEIEYDFFDVNFNIKIMTHKHRNEVEEYFNLDNNYKSNAAFFVKNNEAYIVFNENNYDSQIYIATNSCTQ